MGKMSPILVKLSSGCDSHFELSNTSFSESKLDGVDLNSSRHDCGFERTEEKFYGFWQTALRNLKLFIHLIQFV